MYKINTLEDKFTVYELCDEKNRNIVRIAPERGGIVISLCIDRDEMLFLDRESFYDINRDVRGGIPVLFPVCSKVENEQYVWNGKSYHMGIHGFARDYPWEVLDTQATDTSASIRLTLKANYKTKAVYPFDFELIFTYVLEGNKLYINQEYHNLSSEEMPMYAGFHPYFRISGKDNVEYFVNSQQFLDYDDMKIKDCSQGIDLHTLQKAKLFLDNKDKSVSIVDKQWKRKIEMEMEEAFKYPVLWTAKDAMFICIEPWMAKMYAINNYEGLVLLKPGEVLKTSISICGSRIDI